MCWQAFEVCPDIEKLKGGEDWGCGGLGRKQRLSNETGREKERKKVKRGKNRDGDESTSELISGVIF